MAEVNRLSQSQKGLTLIEAMITVAVIVVAFLGILGTNIFIQQTTEGFFERTLAIQDANQVIERMRSAANEAGVEFQASVQTAATNAAESVSSLPDSHDEVITVTYEDETANPLEVTVTVAWNERGQRATSAVVRSFITRRAG
jgi:Tfp pilus assembly protein PilV